MNFNLKLFSQGFNNELSEPFSKNFSYHVRNFLIIKSWKNNLIFMIRVAMQLDESELDKII